MPGPEATGYKRLRAQRKTQLQDFQILLPHLTEYLATEKTAGDQEVRLATGTTAGDQTKHASTVSMAKVSRLLPEGLNRQVAGTSARDRAEAGVQASFSA